MRTPRHSKLLEDSRTVYQAGVFFLLLFVLAPRTPAQSSETPVPVSTNHNLQTPTSTPTAEPPLQDKNSVPPADPKANSPSKPKRVITNEDLEPRTGGQSHKFADGDSHSWLNCEASCEQQAREEAGYDAEHEAEWQMQVVNARRELTADSEWHRMLQEAIQQSNTYCNFLSQQSQKMSPSGNSYSALVQRAKADEYFRNMDNVLRQKLQTLANEMTRHTNESGALSPVRGAMMYVQGNRILRRTCEFPPPQ
jgi:hypothetical protein